jgi:tripartite-type tricarboxylate transporter receptor subunit TctC
MIAFAAQILMTRPSSPFKSVKGLITAARAKPGELTYASAGGGTLPHLSAERFSRLVNIRLLHAPYKGVAAALLDLMAGRANVAFGNIGTGLPHVNSGELVGLAVTSAARARQLPDTPTLAEAANRPGFEMNDWFGALVPAATPKPVVDQLHGIIVKALATPGEAHQGLGSTQRVAPLPKNEEKNTCDCQQQRSR